MPGFVGLDPPVGAADAGAAQKPCLEMHQPPARIKGFTRCNLVCTQTDVYVQITIDKHTRVAHGEAMTNEKQLRVALYARVSTQNGRQDTQNQLEQLRDFCAKQGWATPYEYVDHASGKHSDRPKFQQMFDAASRREFDCLL